MKCIQETPPFAPKQNKLRAYFKILHLKFSHKNFKVNTKDKKLKQTAFQTRNRESHQVTTSQSSF